MVAYNFQKQFAGDVESGKKTQTIRKAGKRNPPKVGDELQLYTGMRTTSCRKLADVICTEVKDIKIDPRFGEVLIKLPGQINWLVFDSHESVLKLAAWDGFKSTKAFFTFFEEQAGDDGVFVGHLIQWEPAK